MGSPQYSILYSAPLSSSVASGAAMDVLINDAASPTGFVLATTANRAGRRSTGLALSDYSAGGVVDIQQEGQVAAAVTLLGAGAASLVRVSTLGKLERIASPGATDDVVGYVEADGTFHCRFGQVPGGYGASSSFVAPTGTGIVTTTAGALNAASLANPGAGTYELQCINGTLTWVSLAVAPTLTSLNFAQGDIAGGGQSIVATGTNCLTVTSVTIAGASVAPTGTTATTVTFTLPAHASGTGTVSLTGPGGTSGTLAFEYWSPVQVTGIDFYLDANKGVTGGAAVSAWTDQSANAVAFAQATGANKPAQTASVFGTLPAIRYTPEQWLACTARPYASSLSVFAVAKWTATKTTLNGGFGAVPLSIVGDTANGNTCFGASAGAINYTNTGTTAQITRGSGLNTGTPQLIGVTQSSVPATKHYLGTAQQGATETATAFSAGTQINVVGESSQLVDGWNGDIGAVIAVNAVISAGDLTKLNAWSQQRFGTP